MDQGKSTPAGESPAKKKEESEMDKDPSSEKVVADAKARVMTLTAGGDGKGEDGTALPETSGIGDIAKSPDAAADPKLQEDSTPPTMLSLAAISMDEMSIPVRNGFESSLRYELSKRKQTPTFMTDQPDHIGDMSTEKEEMMSRLGLIWDVMKRHYYRVEDVETILNMEDIKRTAKPGFDMDSYYRSLNAWQQDQLRDSVARKANARAQKDLTHDKVYNILLPVERKIFEIMQQIITDQERTYDELHDFMLKGVLSTKFETIVAKHDFVDRRFAFTQKPAYQNRWVQFLEKNQNFVGMYVDMVNGLLGEQLHVASKNATVMTDRILGASQIETTKLDRTVQMSGAIKSAHVGEMIRLIVLKRLLGPMVRAQIHFTPEIYVIEQIFASVLIRLFPKATFDKETRNLADNTFFLQVVNPAWLQVPDAQINIRAVREGAINLMEIHRGAAAVPAEVWALFSETGWSDGMDYEPEVVDQRFTEYLNTPTGTHFTPWQGAYHQVGDPARIVGLLKDMYQKMPNAIANNTSAGRYFKALMRIITEGMQSYANMSYVLDFAMLQLRGMPSWPSTSSNIDDVWDGAREYHVDMMAPISVSFLVDPEKMEVSGIDLRPWKLGQVLNEWATQLSVAYHISRTALARKYYKRATVVAEARKRMMIKFPPLERFLDELVLPPVKDTFTIPPPPTDHWMWRAFHAAQEIVDQAPESYGWKEEFYLMRDTEHRDDTAFVRYEWTYRNEDVDVAFDREGFERVIYRGFNGIADRVMRDGAVVRVQIPVAFDVTKHVERPTQNMDAAVKTDMKGARIYSLGKMFYGWTDEDESYDYERRSDPFRRAPMAVVTRPNTLHPGVPVDWPFQFEGWYDVRNSSWKKYTVDDFVRILTMEEAPS